MENKDLRVPLALEQFLVIEVCLHTLLMFLPEQKTKNDTG